MMCAWLLKEDARPRISLQPDRKILPVDYFHVRVGARRRAGSSRRPFCSRCWLPGRQRLPLRQGSEGILPAAGHRTSAGQRHGPAAHLLSGAGGRRRSGSRRRSGRIRTSKPSPWWRAPAAADSAAELGTDQRSAQAGGGSQVHFGPGDRPPAPPDVRRAGAVLFLQNSQDVRVGGRQGNAQYQYTLQAPDFDSLAYWGPKVLDKLSTLPEIADVSSDQQNSGLSSNVVIDRDTASRLGLTAQAVDSALYDAFGQRQVSVMYKSINQYHVVLALQQQWWAEPGLPEHDLRADAAGHQRSSVDFHALHAGHYAHFAAAPGAVSGHHAFVQPAGRRGAERRRGGHQAGGGGNGPAGQHHRQVRRHRAGLSGSAAAISRS